MSIIRNPYNSVGLYPPEPYGSVNDKPTLAKFNRNCWFKSK